MDTLSETADKVDQGLQNMGLDGTSVKQSLKDILNFKEYLTEQLPASLRKVLTRIMQRLQSTEPAS